MLRNKGFPFSVNTFLIESCVNPTLDYGGEILGFKKFQSAHNIYLRAARAFIGLPKNALALGIKCEVNWLLPQYRRQLKRLRYLHRLMKMSDDRLTKKIFLWNKKLDNSGRISTWTQELNLS